jgi:ADP-heptose:LPS heptosyltransferase
VAGPVLVHLASGIGNIVLATPLLVALSELGLTVDVCLSADYPPTAELLHGWSILRNVFSDPAALRSAASYDAILPAVPPYYWNRFRRAYQDQRWRTVSRPPDALFYSDEQAYYLAFARCLGYPGDRHPDLALPVGPSGRVSPETVVLAPGCKTGEMAAKRWPWFTRLAELLPEVAVVGTADDLFDADGKPLRFPAHVQNLTGRLSLRETAETIAGARLVVANDTGLAWVAAAVGTPTIAIFGPTPDRTLGPMPDHVIVMRSGLPCEPCWFTTRFGQCGRRIDCLRGLAAERVRSVIEEVTPVS